MEATVPDGEPLPARGEKLPELQALRGVAVMLVVGFHLMSIERKYGGGTVLPGALELGMAGVDLFFAISGFVMALLVRGRFHSGRESARFLLRRATRIYPPYWFFTALVLVVWWARPAWVNASQGGLSDPVRSLLLLPMDGLPILMVGWTLIHEMYFYLVTALLTLFLPERRFVPALLAWGAATAVLSALSGLSGPASLAGPAPGPVWRLLASPLTLEFIAGCLAAVAWTRLRRGIPWAPWGALAVAGLAAAGLLFHHRLTGRIMPEGWARALLLGLPAAALVFAALARVRTGSSRAGSAGPAAAPGAPGRASPAAPKWLVRVGDASYSTYLSHVLVLSACGRAWAAFALPGRADNLAMLPLLFLAALLAGWIFYRAVERPMLALFRGKPARYASTAAQAPASRTTS